MANSSPRDPVADLVAALESTLKLTRCADVAALRALPAEKGPRFVVGRRLRVGSHYDVQPAITIYDPSLGTLAFVEHVPRDGDDPSAKAWNVIERATGVRQILIDELVRGTAIAAAAPLPAKSSESRVLPLQIELVLLVSGAPPTSEPDPIRVTLSKVARDTGYLRLIGLSVLDLDQHPALGEEVLRRAFAWLLRGTSAWFRRIDQTTPATAWRQVGTPVSMTLENYRLAGTRTFSCDGTAWLNLVHGHNGSGKSSLAEAVELLLTTRIQRLDDASEPNYFRIVRHRPFGTSDEQLAALGSCCVSLASAGAPVSKVVIESGKKLAREGAQPSGRLQTNSFRIDQVFMDKLIRSQAAGRAALFLNAFSPGDADLLASLHEAQTKMRAAWATLPEHVRRKGEAETITATLPDQAAAQPTRSTLTEEEMAAFVVREFASLAPEAPPAAESAAAAAAPAEVSKAALEGLLPIGQSELRRLAQVHPPIGERLDDLLAVTSADALTKALPELESALNVVRQQLAPLVADLATALRLFHEFRDLHLAHRGPSGDFEANLRRWLEVQALFDLTSRYADIVTAVEAATAANWVADGADALLAATAGHPGGAAHLAARRADLVKELSKLRRHVESASVPETESPTAVSAPARTWLLPTEIEALNRVGAFLTSARGAAPLGTLFTLALAGHEQDLFQGTIGQAGGLEHVIEEAIDLKHACESLQHASAPGSATSGGGAEQATKDVVAAARTLLKLASDLPQSFFHRLARGKPEELNDLAAAFNELLALITPARWAYRDIRIRADLPNGAPSLGLQTVEGAPADLLFNTAELNASALVLFLLLAPRLPNELRLLVLDDPLQNMDELTVVTLARALAKLRILYPRNWVVLAFFHGEQNIERIREEAPCHVYHLPWLQTAATRDIDPVGGHADCAWQELTDALVADPPPRVAAVPPAAT